MNKSDEVEFAKTLQLAAIAYDREVDMETTLVYLEFLGDYSIEQIKTAVKAHCKGTGVESKFFPKVADITAQIHGSKKEVEQIEQDKAEIAWLTILKAIRLTGGSRVPTFKDPVMASCVGVMGWQTLCLTDKDKMVWKQQKFVEHYQSFSKRPLEQLPYSIHSDGDVKQLESSMTTILTKLENLKVEK
tara:strand:- start:900 stop:1463 length:564 start_codon:yes stop_codon:yes gene_type:complete